MRGYRLRYAFDFDAMCAAYFSVAIHLFAGFDFDGIPACAGLFCFKRGAMSHGTRARFIAFHTLTSAID